MTGVQRYEVGNVVTGFYNSVWSTFSTQRRMSIYLKAYIPHTICLIQSA